MTGVPQNSVIQHKSLFGMVVLEAVVKRLVIFTPVTYDLANGQASKIRFWLKNKKLIYGGRPRLSLFRTSFVSVLVLIPMLSHAVILPLEGRLETAPGSGVFQAYYDPNLGISLLADANAMKTSGLDADGLVTWDTATAWAAGLSVGGVSSWRLASSDVNGDGTLVNCASGGVTGCEDNELGFLFWEEGITFDTPGPFINIEQSNRYWTNTENTASLADDAWAFDMVNGGIQISTNKNADIHFAWAVYDGDVAAVPVPAAIWLFGFGLLGLIGISREKRAA